MIRQAEVAGGAGLVVAAAVQRLDQQSAAELMQPGREGTVGVGGFRRRRQAEVLGGDLAGRIAARIIAEAISAGDTSRAALQRYQHEWADGIGRAMARNYRLRARFPPEQRTDERFMHLFAMSIGAGK